MNFVSDASLVVFHHGLTTLYLLVYVDDIIITDNSDASVEALIQKLVACFSIKDFGILSYFLGFRVIPHFGGIFLSQQSYIIDVHDNFDWVGDHEFEEAKGNGYEEAKGNGYERHRS